MSKKGYGTTISGLGFMTGGFCIYALSALIMGGVIYAWSADPRDDPMTLLCFPLLVSLIAIIFFLYGILQIYKDALMISYDHRSKVKIAIILIIVGFVFNQIGSSMDYQFRTVDALQSSFVDRGIFSLLTNMAYGLMPVVLVYEIADSKAKKYLYLGASILIGLSLVLLVLYSSYLITNGDVDEVAFRGLRMTSLATIFTSVGYLSFAFGYRRVAESLREREKSDKIEPKIGYSKEIETSHGSEMFANSKKQKCPMCKKNELDVSSDGSAYCENCGHAERDHRDREDTSNHSKNTSQ